MLGLIGNLDLLELVVIAAVALMVFGKRLPEVAVKGAGQLMKLRREVSRMWREAGLEEELRKVRRDVDRSMPRNLPAPEALIRRLEDEVEGASPPDTPGYPTSPENPNDPLAREALTHEPTEELPEETVDETPPPQEPDPDPPQDGAGEKAT